MHLQRTRSRDDNDSVWFETADTTFDIAELFHSHIRPEATFGEYVANAVWRVTRFRASELECNPIGEDGRISVRNIGKGTCVYEYRCTL